MGNYILGFGEISGTAGLSRGAVGMLIGFIAEGKNKLKVKLHTGNPGEAGTANAATETTEKEVSLTEAAALTVLTWKEGRKSTAAVEWPEVKANETYRWISLRDPLGPKFVLAIELTAPVTVTIGDTFRINKEKLVIKLKAE